MSILKFSFATFLSLVSVSLALSQHIEDSTVLKYHFNHDYNYDADTVPKPPFHADSLLRHAAKFIGTVYLPNGKEPGGFDCSGFTFYNFKRYGIYLPYYSFQQAEVGQPVATTEAKKGDLILFKGHDINSVKAGHVGIVADIIGGRIKFIHASTSKGVKYDFIDAPYYKERFMMIRRIIE